MPAALHQRLSRKAQSRSCYSTVSQIQLTTAVRLVPDALATTGAH